MSDVYKRQKESSASFTKAKLDADDDGDAVYDIEFYTASTRYDYEVNAVSGNIVSTQQKPRNTAPADQVIGEEKAKQIALEHAGVSASKAAFTKVKLDWDDGKQVYEIEFYQKNQEYDYEIDALTGKVLEFDHDAESYTPPKDCLLYTSRRDPVRRRPPTRRRLLMRSNFRFL